MANNKWLLLSVTLYLIIATELRTTVAKHQPSSFPERTQPVRFQPISLKEYQSIMKLTAGKPVISEDRLMSSNYRSLSSIRKSITNMMVTNKHKPRKTKRYPLCVIKTNLKSSKRRNRNGAHYAEMMYHSPYARVTTGGVQSSSSRDRVKCIVVTPPIENCHTNPNAPGCLGNCDPNQDPACPGYCAQHPNDHRCCDPNKDPDCPGYCSLHPRDPDCCDPSDDPRCPGYCSFHPRDPDCCDPKVEKGCPGYCDLHREDPTCCDRNVERSCPGYCALHPLDPFCCVDPTCPNYCVLHPLEPACCDAYPENCMCTPGVDCPSRRRTKYPMRRYPSYSKYSHFVDPYSVNPNALPKLGQSSYDDYTQFYQQLYAGYGGLSPTYAAYNLFPSIGDQFNSPIEGSLDSNDVQNGSNENLSGENSDEEENNEGFTLNARKQYV